MATTTTTLPRPSRPSLNPPPTGPLPALPLLNARQSSASPSGLPASPRLSSISQLPSLGDKPSRSPSGVQSAPSTKLLQTNSTSNIPTVSSSFNASHESASDGTLRTALSMGSFPRPPSGGIRVPSWPPQPSSPSIKAHRHAAETPREANNAARSASAGDGSLKRPKTRNNRLVTKTRQSGGHLSLPSPPPSRSSSAQSTFSTSDPIEAGIDDAERGRRSTSSEKSSKAKDTKGNVTISVRVRPEARNSNGAELQGEWLVDGRRSLVSYRGREAGEYYYDNVFTAHDNNAKVYDSAAKRLVRRVMEGYSGTVFAYGMTGTGKTFSMQGTATSPGVIPLAITDIFSFIRETPHREFLLRVSYLEIYNEKIYDLLSGQGTAGHNAVGMPQQEEIRLREDGKGKVYATPLKEEIVQSPTQLLRVIARGDYARRTGTTQYNPRSSRSHAVVQIVVESRERILGSQTLNDSKRLRVAPGGVRVSTLSLIDLAGSEKAAESKERRTEGAHINKSLLTLGTVIARLSGEKDKQGNPTDKDGKHLPYRDSKLTRLLQPALSGNSLISILCTIQIGATGSVAATSSHTGETLNTLKFAARARNNIVSHAKKAEEAFASGDAGSRALLDRYRLEILELRKQLEDQSNHQARDHFRSRDEEEEKARELEAEQRHEEQMLEMQIARTALKERIEHLNRLILSSRSLGVNSNRSFSSLSMLPRASLPSTKESTRRSTHSSTSEGTLDLSYPSGAGSVISINPAAPNNQSAISVVHEAGSEEEDSLGDNGDGSASLSAQVRALQADLTDKNRYILTLEKRLLQARRASHSRVSLSLSPASEDGGREDMLREKDTEIAELRAKLADKDRMLTALRSAARKSERADLSIDVAALQVADSSNLNSQKRASNVSTSSTNPKAQIMSPVALLSSSSEKRVTGVDSLSKLLDEMIQDRVDSGHFDVVGPRSGSTGARLPQDKRLELAQVAVSSIFDPEALASRGS